VNVLVLGCGPAGLTATKAALDAGHEVTVVAKGLRPSRLYGCQYLHAPIPGYEDAPFVQVSYELNGTPEQYRRKVYGNSWDGPVSPEDLSTEHMAWDIRDTYVRLWRDIMDGYAIRREDMTVGYGMLGRLSKFKPDKTVSTIPAFNLCMNYHHSFRSLVIYANGATGPDMSQPNHVLCDGTEANAWYRISNVFGYQTTEWPITCPENMGAKVTKPLYTDCTCNPEILRVGRYGAWSKSILVHQVYDQVREALK